MHLQLKDGWPRVGPGALVPRVCDEALVRNLARFVPSERARGVLARVGLAGVRSLTMDELIAAGVPDGDAESIVALRDVSEALRDDGPGVVGPLDLIRELPPQLALLEIEVVLAVALDSANHVKALILIAIGGHSACAFSMADVFRPLMRFGATAFALVHNHPSGDPKPSRDDVILTNRVAAAGLMLDVPLIDHVIVARRGTVSLSELGLLPEREDLDLLTAGGGS